MQVTEIFTSVQGESTQAGRLCTFIRTTGCDQRCTWCDTDYAFHGGTPMTLDHLYGEVAERDVPLVEVTGGEPLLQPDILPFLSGLADRGHEVMLETGGSLPMDAVDPRVRRILDIKPPGSGMHDRIHWPNLGHLRTADATGPDPRPGDEVKFVLTGRDDYEWARHVVTSHQLADRVPVLLAPAFDLLPLAQLAEWIISDRLPVRFQPQIHKWIWTPSLRGV